MRISRKLGLYAGMNSFNGIFFDNGDQCEAVTGGWTKEGYSLSNRTNYGTTTIDETIYVYSSATFTAAMAGTVNAVDLTKVNFLHCNVSERASSGSPFYFGVSSTKVCDTGTVAQLEITTTGVHSLDVSELRGEYYIYMYIVVSSSQSTRYARVSKVWGSKDIPITEKSLESSIAINATYRHCNALYTSNFVRVGSLGSDLQGINYVGEGTDDYNAMMIPVSAFTFNGTFQKLSLALHLWTSDNKNHTFRWAVTTSRDNEDLYKSYGDVTNDANQLAAGSFTPPYSSSYQWYTIEFTDCTVTSGTPLYIYLWRDNTTYGNIHVNNSAVVTLEYTK